jgi:hemerythrin-like domain-containing protein
MLIPIDKIMKDAIETLMNEHRLIEQVLGALDTFVEQLFTPVPEDRRQVGQFAWFFRHFADHCHHGKEEKELFVQMNRCGFPMEYGPLGVMLAEHGEGREHVGALAEIGRGTGPLSLPEREAVAEHARALIPLLRAHIQKEDNILYPMARQGIPPAEIARLNESCEVFDREVMGAGEIQRLKALASELLVNFPPDAEKMAVVTGCAGCRGH